MQSRRPYEIAQAYSSCATTYSTPTAPCIKIDVQPPPYSPALTETALNGDFPETGGAEQEAVFRLLNTSHADDRLARFGYTEQLTG
ncbi:MAG: hypothetical protein ABW185_23535 [Sedimenticola sp.]